MDHYSDYEKFLRGVTDEVGSLVSDKRNLCRFRRQARLFIKQYETHCDAVEQWDEKAAKDPRLCDNSKGPPEPGWLWKSTLHIRRSKTLTTDGHWTPSEEQFPPNPFKWFTGPPVFIGASHEEEQLCQENNALPYREILLPCYYVLLITVHDKWCPSGFPLISEGVWSQEEGDWGHELRNAVFKDLRGEYNFRFKRKIEWALKKVKADLASVSTEAQLLSRVAQRSGSTGEDPKGEDETTKGVENSLTKAEKQASRKGKKRRRRVSSKLTPRQHEVYRLINCRGLTHKQAAIELQCSDQNISQVLAKAEKKVNAEGSRSVNLANSQKLPTDKRGQVHLADEDDRVAGSAN
jgi:hypothetical protein